MEEGEGTLHLTTISTKQTFIQKSSSSPPPPPSAKYQTTIASSSQPPAIINSTTSKKSSPTNHYCWLYEDIVLKRNELGLGFTITGGSDTSVRKNSNETQICITKIMPGSAAALDGRLRVNDCIVSVNDLVITDVPHATAVETLNKAGTLVRLSIKRKRPISAPPLPTVEPLATELSLSKLPLVIEPPTENLTMESVAVPSSKRMEIKLTKSNGRFGFSISGGVGNQQRFGDNGIFVTRIQEGGSAYIDGKLSIGDRLVAVRGNDVEIDLENVSHDTAVDSLVSVDVVTLVVDKNDFDS